MSFQNEYINILRFVSAAVNFRFVTMNYTQIPKSIQIQAHDCFGREKSQKVRIIGR